MPWLTCLIKGTKGRYAHGKSGRRFRHGRSRLSAACTHSTPHSGPGSVALPAVLIRRSLAIPSEMLLLFLFFFAFLSFRAFCFLPFTDLSKSQVASQQTRRSRGCPAISIPPVCFLNEFKEFNNTKPAFQLIKTFLCLFVTCPWHR